MRTQTHQCHNTKSIREYNKEKMSEQAIKTRIKLPKTSGIEETKSNSQKMKLATVDTVNNYDNLQISAEQLASRLNVKPIYLTEDKTSWYILVKKWIPSPSKEIFDLEWEKHPTELRPLNLFGKTVYENRYSQAFGVTYAYSGSKNTARPIEDGSTIHTMMEKINGLIMDMKYDDKKPRSENSNDHRDDDDDDDAVPTARVKVPSFFPYNGCLQNWYTPEQTIGYHSDDTKSLINGYPILSISWGGSRRFILRRKKNKGRGGDGNSSTTAATSTHDKNVELIINDGDLLVMGGACQETHQHGVPKVRKTMDPSTSNRISFTFRAFCV